MKTLKNLSLFLVLIVGLTVNYSCQDDDDQIQVDRPNDLVRLIEGTPELSSLYAALLAADGNLPQALSGNSFTIFAPTNEAFNAFLSANNFSSLDQVPTDVLSQVLLNHVVSGEAKSSDLTTTYINTLATESSSGENLSMYVDTSSGGVTLNGISNVIAADQMAINGVVHIVDTVIGLPSVVDFALADDTFSTLVAALTRGDLTTDYVGVLTSSASPAPFTVFAPTNNAFADLLAELGLNSLSEIDEPTLNATLALHAVAGANVRSGDLSDNMMVPTLGGDITANVSGGPSLTDTNGRIINIIVTDVQAANGVIHVIDKVILPLIPNITGLALNTPELSSLVAALQAASGNLVDLLRGEGPFTVLAPSNAAFAAIDTSGLSAEQLEQILRNHVISGELMASDLVGLGSGYTSTSASGAGGNAMSIYFDTSNGVTFNGISNVTAPDIEATNGVIHIVDAVIGLPTIVDHAVANSNFSSLVGALTMNGNTTFTDLLSSPGDFTVFAPDNNAFASFMNPNGNDLNQILSNHVIVGATAVSTGLTNSYVNTAATFSDTANNLSMYINTDSGVTINGSSSVSSADIIASNGVIHVVDTVIDLPTVVDFAVADPTFSTLVSALTRNDLTFDYVGALSTPNGSPPAPFTVFAPTNEAFGSLLTELNLNGLGDIPEPTLKATLDHHAVAGLNVLSTDLSDNMTVPTLGGNITANVTGGATLTDANNRISNIIAVDVQASNGVIHVIDKVVLPPLN